MLDNLLRYAAERGLVVMPLFQGGVFVKWIAVKR